MFFLSDFLTFVSVSSVVAAYILQAADQSEQAATVSMWPDGQIVADLEDCCRKRLHRYQEEGILKEIKQTTSNSIHLKQDQCW